MTTRAYRKAQAAALRAAVPLSGVLAAGLLATGCGVAGHIGGLVKPASTSGSAGLPPSVTPSAAQTPSPAATPVAGSTGSGSQSGASGPQCLAKALKITMGRGNGAAGSIYYPLDFTNTSGVRCTMYGYPGVAFVTRPGGTAAGGTVLGAPAVRDSTIVGKLVTLAPGATAHASLRVQVAQSYPAAICKPVTGHWLQIYPPGSYAARYIRFTAVTCTGKIPSRSTLGIYAVLPGATAP